MNTRLKKALADLWVNPGRSALVVLALIIGLWGVGSNLVSFTVLKNDLNENFVRTNPYHVAMTSKDFSKLDIDEFRDRKEVESADFRDLTYKRIEVFPNQWIPLWIFGVKDFDNMPLAHLYTEQGKKKPEPGSMLIERNGQLVSDLRLGSVANVRVGSSTLHIPISGISFDPAQAPATQDSFIYSYVDQNTYTSITGEPINQRLIFRLNNVSSKSDVQTYTRAIVDNFNSKGIRIESIDIPQVNKHPHQFQLNTLLAFQGGIGLLALIMGAVLVSQLMEAILTQQVKQIGALKAIGGTRSQVLGIYLTMVVIMGAVASSIAIPIAVASGYGFAGFVATVLNFEILTTSLPLSTYIYLALFGLFLPVLLAFPTLRSGVSISVKDALSDYGIKSNTEDKQTNSVNKLPVPFHLRLALGNIFRRQKRMLITVSMIALGVAIFSSGFNVRQSLINFLQDTKDSMKYDVQVVLRDQIPPEIALAPFQSLKNVNHVETWSGGTGRLQSGVVKAGNGIGIVALPYDTDLMKWDVIKGRWLKPDKELEVVINQTAADKLESPKIGSLLPVSLNGADIQARLVGVISEFNVAKLYVDKTQYDALVNPQHKINSVIFTASDRSFDKVVELKEEIEKRISQSDLDVLFVMSQSERAQIIYNHLDIILTLFAFLSLVVLLVSALGMASATGINILERTREIGVMRAIGATPKSIYSLFVAEGMLINSMGIVVGLLLALPLSTFAAKFFGNLILGHNVSLEFAFSHYGFIATLLVTIVFSWLASRIPARKAVTVSNREALSYE